MVSRQMPSMNCDLPDTPEFDSPPIVEAVLGVQFRPLTEMRVTHFGHAQKLYESRGFTQVQEYPPLQHIVEQQETNIQFISTFPFIMPNPFLTRVWYLSLETEAGQRMIQLQNDRLIQNWRRGSLANTTYPSYKKTKQEFVGTLESFIKFVEDNKLGQVVIDQCEIVYVNHILMADFSNVSDAFRACFNIALPASTLAQANSDMQRMEFSSTFWNSNLKGRVYVQASSPLPNQPSQQAIDFRLTARGAPKDSSVESILDWMDLGHNLVVNTFADLTTEEMHKQWERTK